MSLFVTLLTIAVIAIPIVVVVKIVRRLQRVSRRFSDPARLQRVFAESAAAALRRAGADPEAVARLEVVSAMPTRPRDVAAAEPIQRFEDELQPRLQPLRRPARPRMRPKQSPIAGLDLGESFRLAEPPEQGEPYVRVAISNWFGVALVAGAAAYYFLR